jgi:hypothetical protein
MLESHATAFIVTRAVLMRFAKRQLFMVHKLIVDGVPLLLQH